MTDKWFLQHIEKSVNQHHFLPDCVTPLQVTEQATHSLR